MPKITVILTSYNHAKYIRETIDSILNQTFKDFELIIWDDASIDESWEIIQSYKDELLEILEGCKENKELQFQERIKFIKKVNYELSMNVFFDEVEAKDLIKELSGLGK